MTIRTTEPLPEDMNAIRKAWIQRQCMAMFVLCLRIAVSAGENLEDLAYPEFVGIDQQQVDDKQEQIVMYARSYTHSYWCIDIYATRYMIPVLVHPPIYALCIRVYCVLHEVGTMSLRVSLHQVK